MYSMAMTQRARRRIFLLIGLCIVVSAGGTIAWAVRQTMRSREAAAARTDGLAAWEVAQYETALPLLSKAATQYLDDIELMLAFADTRGHVPTARGTHTLSAIGIYRRVLALEPKNAAALRGTMELQAAVGMIAQLIDTAKELHAVEPMNPEPLKMLKEVAMLKGRLLPVAGTEDTPADESALRWVDALIDVSPLVIQHRLDRLSLMDEANATTQEVIEQTGQWALEASNEDGRLDVVRATAYASFGMRAEAEQALLEAAAKPMVDPQALLIAIELLKQLNNTAVATALLERAERQAEADPSIARAMIVMAWRDGSRGLVRDRLDSFQGALSAARGDVLFVSRLNAAMGRGEQAKAFLHQSKAFPVDKGVDPAVTGQLEAWADFLHAYLGHEDEHLTQHERVIRTNAAARAAGRLIDRELAQFLLAELYERIGWRTAAIATLRRATDAQGRLHVLSAQQLTRLLLARGRALEALPIAELLIRRHPRSAVAHIEWIRVRAAMERANLDPPREGAVIKPFDSAYTLAKNLAASVDNDVVFRPIMLETALAGGRLDDAHHLIEAMLASDETPIQDFLLMAQLVSRENSLPATSGILVRIAARASERELGQRSLDAMAVLQALQLRRDGEYEASGRFIETYFSGRTDTRSGWILARERVNLARATGSEAFPDLVRTLLAERVDAALLLDLMQTIVAQGDLALALELKTKLDEVYGADDRSSLMLEADIVLGFPNEPTVTLPPFRGVARLVGAIELKLDQEPNDRGLVIRQYRLLDRLEPDNPALATDLLEQIVAARSDAVEFFPPLIGHLQRMGRFDEANRMISRFERRKLDVAPAIRQAVDRLRLGQGDPSTALEAIRISAESEHATVLDKLLYVDMLVLSLKKDEANAVLESLAHNPNRVVAVDQRMAAMHAREGRLEGAIETLRSAPGFVSGASRAAAVASMFLAAKKPQDAIDELRAVSATLESSAYANILVARALLALTDVGQASLALTNAQRLSDSDNLRLNVAQVMMTSPALRAQAVPILHGLLSDQSHEGQVEAMLLAIDAAGEGEEFAPTLQHVGEAHALTRRFPAVELTWTLAQKLYSKYIQKIERNLQDLLRANELDVSALATLRLEHDEVIAAFEDVLRDATDRFASDAQFPRYLAMINLQVRDYDEALQFATLAARRTPGDRVADALITARALKALDRTQQLIAVLKPHEHSFVTRGQERTTEAPGEGYSMLLEAFLKNGEVEHAAALLQRAGGRPLYVKHFEDVLRARSPEVARRGIEALAAQSSSPRDAKFRAAMVLTDVFRNTSNEDIFEEADQLIRSLEEDYSSASNPSPADVFRLVRLKLAAAGLQETRSPADARDSYEAAAAAIPPQVRDRISRFETLSPELKAMLVPWRSILIIALNNQAAMAALDGESFESGLAAINEALVVAANAPELIDTKAMLYLSAGEPAKAVDESMRAVMVAPRRLEFKLTLAKAYAANGNLAGAIELAGEILRANTMQSMPDNTLAEKVSAFIEGLQTNDAG